MVSIQERNISESIGLSDAEAYNAPVDLIVGEIGVD